MRFRTPPGEPVSTRRFRYGAPDAVGGTILHWEVTASRLWEVADEGVRRLQALRRPRARRARPARQGDARRVARRRDRARRGAQPEGQRRRDETLRLRPAGHRRRPARRAVPRAPLPDEGPDRVDRGGPDDARLTVFQRRAAARRRQRARPAAQAPGARDLRPDEHVRAATVTHLRAAALRADEESVGADAPLR